MKIKPSLAIAIVALVACFGSGTAAAQSSIVNSYSTPLLSGTKSVVRSNAAGNTSITAFQTSGNQLCFAIDSAGTRRVVKTWSSTMAPTTGYRVEDMVVDGGRCWFCGQYWWWTGDYIYDIGGNSSWEIKKNGVIGYFDYGGLHDTVTVFFSLIDSTENLTSIAANGLCASAIGTRIDGKSCVVEHRKSGLQWQWHFVTSTLYDEVFMDIVYAGGRFATVSRFNDPKHVFYYKYSLGMRYFKHWQDFDITTCRLYRYDMGLVMDNSVGFGTLGPVSLNFAGGGNERVTVTYLGSNIPGVYDLAGKPLVLDIDHPGSGFDLYCCNKRYASLLETQFVKPPAASAQLCILMTDSSGRSCIVHPAVFSPSTTEALSRAGYNLTSATIMPYSSADVKIVAAGSSTVGSSLYPRSASVYDFLTPNPFWHLFGCFSSESISYYKVNSSGLPSNDNNNLEDDPRIHTAITETRLCTITEDTGLLSCFN